MFPNSFFLQTYFPVSYFPEFGEGLAPVPSFAGRGFKGAGRYLPYMQRMADKRRKHQLAELVTRQVTYTKKALEAGWQAEQAYQKNLASAQMYSVLLSEI